MRRKQLRETARQASTASFAPWVHRDLLARSHQPGPSFQNGRRGGEPHQRAVPAGPRLVERRGSRSAGTVRVRREAFRVEAPAGAILAVLPPPDEAVHQVPAVERPPRPRLSARGQRHDVASVNRRRLVERPPARLLPGGSCRGRRTPASCHCVADGQTRNAPSARFPGCRPRSVPDRRKRVQRSTASWDGLDGGLPRAPHAADRVRGRPPATTGGVDGPGPPRPPCMDSVEP